MSVAMLIDLTRCSGCRGCQTACKAWNDLPAEGTSNLGSYENPRQLSERTWTWVDFHEVEQAGQLRWIFAKRACMHCEHPGCVAACPVGALEKRAAGPVIHDPALCMGCRYCMITCPFGVPSFEWAEPLPVVRKCRFCVDRISAGLEPACVKACPTEAIAYGERDELIVEAHARIDAQPERYVPSVYGEREVGGTSVLYLSAVPVWELGFPRLGSEPTNTTSDLAMRAVPPAAVGLGCALTGLYWFCKRREKASQEKRDGERGDEGDEP